MDHKDVTAIYIGQENSFSKLLTFNLQSNFRFEIRFFTNYVEYELYCANGGSYALIICDGSTPLGDIIETHRYHEYQKHQAPFFIVGNESFLKEFSEFDAKLIQREVFLQEVENHVKEFFEESPLEEPREFCPISFAVLTAFEGLHCDVYIHLPSDRYLKIFQRRDNIIVEDVEKYAEKGVEYLFLKRRVAKWILKEFQEKLPESFTAIEDGGKIEIESPPEELEEEKVVEEKVEEPAAEVAPPEKKVDRKVFEKPDGTFSIKKDYEEEIVENVDRAIKSMKKIVDMKILLGKVNVDRSPENYYQTHVNLLLKVSYALAKLMQWNQEATLKNILIAVYLHDATIMYDEKIINIKSMEEFEKLKGDLSPKEQELFLKHPTHIHQLMESRSEIPTGASDSVFQHHEQPDQKGFPGQVNATKILPQSALFIIAHDLVDYIISDPKWKLKDFIANGKTYYRGASFNQVFPKLKELLIS